MIKKYHYVYISTNLLNGKKYVGDHSTNKLDDNYIGSGLYFNSSKKKYGRKNFKREILEFFNTKKEAFDAQEKYIKLYETHVSQGGYNISWKGGLGIKGEYNHSRETKEKISMNNAKNKYWQDKIFSEKHKKNISKGNKGKNTWSKGSKLSEEHKKKIGEGERGKKVSEETKMRMSIAAKGRSKSKEHIEKIKIARLGIKSPRKNCEYCGKNIATNIYARFHGDKCKSKNI